MKRLIAYRLATAIPLLLLVSILTFSLVHLMPGSPAAAILGPRATPDAIAVLETRLGLDQPLIDQYTSWLGGALALDFGESAFSSRPVGDMIGSRLVATLSLVVSAVLVALVVGMTTGLMAALRPGSLVDRGVAMLTAVGLAVPEFWLGILLLGVFAVQLELLPVISWTPPDRDLVGWAKGLILPAVALGVAGSAVIARQTRAAMLEALDQPFVQTLRAIGTPRRTIVMRYALKNAVIPVLTVTGFLFIALIGASFVIEKVFTIPGLGSLMLDAVNRRDMPVVQGVVMIVAILVVLVYLSLDIVYGLLNPRARPQ
jgi:peptide/nickel transport system permease protein